MILILMEFQIMMTDVHYLKLTTTSKMQTAVLIHFLKLILIMMELLLVLFGLTINGVVLGWAIQNKTEQPLHYLYISPILF